jgi:signal transduction histidine kinase
VPAPPLGVLLAAVSLVLTAIAVFVAADGDRGRPAEEVDLLAGELDPVESALDDHLLWAIAWSNGASITEADIRDRFSSAFLEALPPEELRSQEASIEAAGPYVVRGVLEEGPLDKVLALTGRDDVWFGVLVSVTSTQDPRIETLALFELEGGGVPLRDSTWALAIGAAAACSAVGLVAARRRSRHWRATGAMLSVAGLLAASQVGQLIDASWPFTLGLVAGPVAAAVAAHAVLVGAEVRGGRAVIAAAYGAAVLASAYVLALDTEGAGLPAAPGSAHAPEVAGALLDLRAAAVVLVAASMVVLLARGLSAPRRRSSVVPMAVGGGVAALLVIVVSGEWLVDRGRLDLGMSPVVQVALLVVAVGAAVSLFVDRVELDDVGRLVTDLGDRPARVEVRDSVARALGDESVELWYWSNDLDAYVTADGRRRDDADAGPGRTVTALVAGGEQIAAVVHAGDLGVPPARVASVVAAARLALDNERLQAQVLAQLADVRASRARLVQAADDARHQVERDLHDGAQQRLLAVLLQLRRAESTAADDDPLANAVRRAASDLATALEELRAIGRGLHPPALDHGLGAAFEALAESAPIPVELHVVLPQRTFGAAVDAAAYYVLAEGITNAVRHAGGSHVRVEAAVRDGSLCVDIEDDGVGGATVGAGTGLQRLVDRAAALGGALSVRSEVGAGTRLELRVPVDMEDAA